MLQELSNVSIETLQMYSQQPQVSDCMLLNKMGGYMADWDCVRENLLAQFNTMAFWLAIFLIVTLFIRIYWFQYEDRINIQKKYKDFLSGMIKTFPDAFTIVLCVNIIYYGGMFLFS
jgi:hypothetical protein